MAKEQKKVNATFTGINACDRNVFNRAVAFEEGVTRGEIISRLMREYAEKCFGKEGVAARIEEFEVEQNKLNQKNEDTLFNLSK